MESYYYVLYIYIYIYIYIYVGPEGPRGFGPFHLKLKAHGPRRGGRSAQGWMKGIQTARMYCWGRPCPRQAKIMGEKKMPRRPRTSTRGSQKRFQAIWASHRGIGGEAALGKAVTSVLNTHNQHPDPLWCGCDPWTGRWGPQQLTECQKEWLRGRALEDKHGWVTSVEGGWTEERNK